MFCITNQGTWFAECYFFNFFRYKPVIIFEIGAYWTTWALLVWANGVAWMKFMQFTFGLASATEVAYYTYMYAQVNYTSFLKLFDGLITVTIFCPMQIGGIYQFFIHWIFYSGYYESTRQKTGKSLLYSIFILS